MKHARNDDDTAAWEWVLSVLHHLQADGMSSEESDKEGSEVYRVRIVPWRRQGVVELMELIDGQKKEQQKVWKSRGAKPVPRLRGSAAKLISTRRHVDNLPRALYNAEWLSMAVNSVMVNVSKDDFDWLQVMVRNKSWRS